MVAAIRGVVRGGVVVLADGAELPEGAEVEVRVATQNPSVSPNDNGHSEPEAEPHRPMTEEEWEASMVARGLMWPRLPMTEEDMRASEEWEPLVLEGKPLSEIVIEDRR